MRENKQIYYDNAAEILQDKISSGYLTKITGGSLRSTLSRVLRTVYPDNWGNVELIGMDAEQLFRVYTEIVKDEYKPRDLMITRSRIRRVFRIIRGDDDNPRHGARGTSSDSAFHDTIIAIDSLPRDEKIRFLDAYYCTLNSMCLETLKKTVLNPTGAKHNNYYAIPVTPDKISALSLPKNLTATELETVHKVIDGIFICEIYKKRGGPD